MTLRVTSESLRRRLHPRSCFPIFVCNLCNQRHGMVAASALMFWGPDEWAPRYLRHTRTHKHTHPSDHNKLSTSSFKILCYLCRAAGSHTHTPPAPLGSKATELRAGMGRSTATGRMDHPGLCSCGKPLLLPWDLQRGRGTPVIHIHWGPCVP